MIYTLYSREDFLSKVELGDCVRVNRYTNVIPKTIDNQVRMHPTIEIRYTVEKNDYTYSFNEIFPCDDNGDVQLSSAFYEKFAELNISWTKVVRSGSF